ncbi:NAD(P)/FAD-dependent oxidoreductase [Microbacterium sp. 2FI]|uniref:NAD(P)/FAD-dependent oxidoreductase n=1 Tax=Microbacterium sp. 2FI TaxID=2502193 RepID=UPI0024B4D860|nr:NAD(P)/FAD-dependent oxidoreductase [Microbacterium sp. 2FI]
MVRAVVVGGGIAGSAAGMALQAVGIEAIVLESRTAGVGRGSWLTVAPNGVAALQEIGALEAVRSIGVPTRRNVMIGATGVPLGSIGLGRPLPDGTPALSFRRPELAEALAAEARRRGVDVRHEARVAAVETTDRAAAVTLETGARLEADVVVGADGIHSLVRRAVDPHAPAARYLGLANFGGITRSTGIAAQLPAEAWTFVFGRHAFFGALPTPAGDVVWFVNEPRPVIDRTERATTTDAAWQQHLEDLAAADAGPFAELIAAGTLELVGDSTFDLPRLPTWSRGRLTLIGDAIHAPSPSSGQGASMALEDAVVLAACLSEQVEDSPAAAFAAFDNRRRRRVEKIVADGARSSSSKTAGPVARIFQDRMLRLVFRHFVTDKSQAWVHDYRARLGTARATQ